MDEHARSRNILRIAAIVVVIGALASVGIVLLGERNPANSDPGGANRTAATQDGTSPSSPSASSMTPPIAPAPSGDGGLPGLSEAQRDEIVADEYPVDLAALRQRIPDNLYWRLGVPSKDPDVLRARAEEEKRWNDLYGKVLSGTGSEEEVRAYYEHRRQLSEDYIEFASLVLEQHGDELPERDQGMYELTIEMHNKRLGEIPRQIEEALARKKAQDARREEWRAGGGSPGP